MIAFQRRTHRQPGRSAIALWVVLGLIALFVSRVPSVSRTQEGRVLETARQMQGGGLQARLVPFLNEKPRLQKPPLAYWLSDASYNIFGSESAGTGRVPFVLAAWLTAGLNLWIGTRLFGRRAGVFAMAALLGCVLVSRYGLLAETDVLTMLGVTAAIYANWRAAEAAMETGARSTSRWRVMLLFHAGALATAFTILAKGPQGIFPVVFLIALAATHRRWTPITAWLKSGAPITVVAIASPWFIYIFAALEAATITREVGIAARGGAHGGLFVKYFGYIVLDALPWTGFVVVATWFAARRARHDRRLAGLLLWIAAILVPLCLAGQKQRHYLLPLMPPLMLLAGWYVDRATRSARGSFHASLIRGITLWTLIGCIAAGFALPIAVWQMRQSLLPIDFAAAALLIAVGGVSVALLRRPGTAAAVMASVVAGAAAVLFVQNVWAPTLRATWPRTIAREVRSTFGDRPIRMIGNESLPLMFELKARRGSVRSADEIDAALAEQPTTIFVERRNDDEPSKAPPRLIERLTYVEDGDAVSVFEAR